MNTDPRTEYEERRLTKLRQIRKLLAKADGGTTIEEADSLRAKAHALMDEFAIEMFEIQDDEGNTRVEPVARPIEFNWYREHSQAEYLWSLFLDCARHCRVKPVIHVGINVERDGNYTLMCVGMPHDLDYFEMLFTHLMLQMSEQIEPRPRPGESMIDYLVRAKEAGMKWEDMATRMLAAGIADFPEYKRNVGVRFTKLYTDYCKETGRERMRTAPTVYARNFASGFVAGVAEKFRQDRLLKEQNLNATGVDSTNALALRDVYQIVIAKADELFPRTKGTRRGRVSYRQDTRKSDAGARAAGQVAGRTASTQPTGREQVGTSKKELTR